MIRQPCKTIQQATELLAIEMRMKQQEQYIAIEFERGAQQQQQHDQKERETNAPRIGSYQQCYPGSKADHEANNAI